MLGSQIVAEVTGTKIKLKLRIDESDMAPNQMTVNGHAQTVCNGQTKTSTTTLVANGHGHQDEITLNRHQAKDATESKPMAPDKKVPIYKRKDLIWENIISNAIFHCIAAYGFLTFPYFSKLGTLAWFFIVGWFSGFGVTGGAHRLWAHKSYKAKLPLRILLLIAYATAGQYSIFWWARDHRVHHKYTETDADPHNATRGFFFSHVGWLMCKRHPEVIKQGKKIDMSDVLADPVVQFGEKHWKLLKLTFCFVLPVLVPVYCWNEEWYWAIMSQVFMRYMYILNATWAVNSAAHMWGTRPYDKEMHPAENPLVSIFAQGEGWHNYHHVFPWDYKAAELPGHFINPTTLWIELFAKIGWAYDLKQPSNDLIQKTVYKRGDGSHHMYEVKKDD